MTHVDDVATVVNIEVLTEDRVYTVTDLCSICRVDEHALQEYLDYGVIVFESPESRQFRQTQLDRLLRAQRLKRDLELNNAGVALALDLLDEIENLQRDLALLKR